MNMMYFTIVLMTVINMFIWTICLNYILQYRWYLNMLNKHTTQIHKIMHKLEMFKNE